MTRFNSDADFIIVAVAIEGAAGLLLFDFALDTGSNFSVVHPDVLLDLGYDLNAPVETFNLATANGSVPVKSYRLDSLTALGLTRDDVVVVSHALPLETQIDGVLGLDFLRNRRLTLDFNRGKIELV